MAFRDYRDNFGSEIFQALGYAEVPLVFSRTDWPIALKSLAMKLNAPLRGKLVPA